MRYVNVAFTLQLRRTLDVIRAVSAMPTGPKGERRPADVIGNAVMIAKIATGEIEDTKSMTPGRIKSGKAGGAARVEMLSAEDRQAIAKKAAATRWS